MNERSNEAFCLGPLTITKGSNLEKLLNDYNDIIKKGDIESFTKFILTIFKGCMDYLANRYNFEFPTIVLTKYYNHEEFLQMWQTLRQPGPVPIAFLIHAKPIRIVVDLGSIIDLNPPSFITNLVCAFMEELLHIILPELNESEIKPLTYQNVEKYLGINIPEEFKKYAVVLEQKKDERWEYFVLFGGFMMAIGILVWFFYTILYGLAIMIVGVAMMIAGAAVKPKAPSPALRGRFCKNCGRSLESLPADISKCPYCGSDL